MQARNPLEAHRTATPLELLFDLCFVVAVALAAAELHHTLTKGYVGAAVLSYLMVFFAIWWAWMNFTWFASAYDIDDVPYRLATLVQIAGVLILAAGVPRAFEQRDFSVVTLGYVVMRVALVAQWLRAANADPDHRCTALRYAAGVTVCQIGWVSILALPREWQMAAWAVLVLAELSVPVWAENAGITPWHPHHIAERYGLFTLIVLGESILAASMAIQSGLDAGERLLPLLTVAGSGLIIVFAMWWLYFDRHARTELKSSLGGFVWGYGHLVIFAAVAAVGAGLAVAVDFQTGKALLPPGAATAVVALPVAVYLLGVWALYLRQYRGPLQMLAFPVGAALLLGAAAANLPLPFVATVLALLVALTVATPLRR